MPAAPLLAVDGHHLLYRSWHGFTDRRITSRDKTRDLTAVFGFLAILRKTHLEAAPCHEIIVAFDAEDAAASRQAADSRYKAGRAAADHAPVKSLGMVKHGLDAAGVRWAEISGAEGDDLLATLAATATAEGRAVTCYTGDQDMYQILTSSVCILTPARRRVTAGQLPGSHGVTPPQWPDYRALTGDPADNIPGIPGIGPKTAAALLTGGIHLEQLRGSPRLDQPRCRAVHACWEQLITWRDIIRLNPRILLPHGLITGQATSAMPRAAEILGQLGLW
jgi:DNA polymerase-1